MKLQKTKKAWFELPDDPDKTAFEINHLRAGEVSEITEAANSRRFEFREDKESGDLKPVPIFESNGNSERELTIIAAISDWKNVFDADGNELDCTDENKKRVCRELGDKDFTAFFLFIQDCRKKLDVEIQKESEKHKKN